MRRKYRSVAVANVIISLIFILVGIEELRSGADPASRFYFIDNILIRVLGLLFIVFSIGLLFRKNLARKGIIIVCLISMLEAMATYDYSYGLTDIVTTFIIFAVIFVGPAIFYMLPKVRSYYYASREELKSIDEDERFYYKHSGVGVASFVIAIVNIVLTILEVILVSRGELNLGAGGQIAIGILSIFLLFSGIIGLPLGIAGLLSRRTKKTFSIWGTVINGLFVLFFIIVLFTLFKNIDQIEDIFYDTFEAMLY